MTARAILIAAILTAPLPSLAAAPDAEVLLKGMIQAAGGMDAFRELGVLEISLTEEETTTKGTQRNQQSTAYVDATTLANMRLDLAGDVVVARNGATGWATISGAADERPQASRSALAALNMRLVPLLLPFTLTMDGIRFGEIHETSFEGEPAWRVALSFPHGFFLSPSMDTTWYLHVRKSDSALLAAEFYPPKDIRQIRSEGVRYRVLKQTTIGSGVRLPAQVLLDGIDLNGSPTGHVRVTKMQIRVRGPFEPALFLDPTQLKAIEEGME
jgi:hypothetical protein